MKQSGVTTIIWFLLFCWMSISVAALFGEYRLWWQRERVLYAGKTVDQQREVVFQRAGIPATLVQKINVLLEKWPTHLKYSATGNFTSLSYIQYLLIPRVPSGGDSDYSIHLEGDTLITTESASLLQQKNETGVAKTPVGFLLSLLFLSGVAVFLKRIFRVSMSWPESFALTCLFLSLLTLFEKFFFHSVSHVFYFTRFIGLVGWGLGLWGVISSRYSPKTLGNNICSDFCDMFSEVRGNRITTAWFLLLVSVIILNIFWSYIMAVIVLPDDWDAWAIWGAKAKMLALGNGPLFDVTYFGHPDYPLLWPIIWAFSGFCSFIGWEEQWSRGWGTVFLIVTVWELMAIVRYQTKSYLAGVMAAAVLVSIPMVPLLASWSYAEAPLWFFSLCTLAALMKWCKNGGNEQIVLMGLFAAGAAFTKNEGILLALLMGLALLAVSGRKLKDFCLYVLIFLLCYFPWYFWVRILHDFGSHATGGIFFTADNIERVVSRIPASYEAIMNMWKDIRQWSVVGFSIGMGWLYLLFSPNYKKYTLLMLPFLMLLSFWGIIVFHTDEIYWQVGTSWNRLSVQMLVLFIPVVVSGLWQLYQKDL